MRCTHRGRSGRDPGGSGPAGPGQRRLRCRHMLSVMNFGHSPHPPASQPLILVTIPPTVYRPLDQAPLSLQARVQLRQRPSDGVALGFVDQPIAAVLILTAAGSRIDAVLRPKLGRQLLHVDRFHIAPDRVFHFHSIARVFKRDPLHTVVVLVNHQRRRRRNRSWRGGRTRSTPTGRAGMQRCAVALRTGGRIVTGTDRTRGRSLQRCWIERSLHHRRFHFRSRAVCHPGGWRLLGRRLWLMLHGRLSLLMRHQHRL